MKLQEKRHGPLNSTHDASLDELSEVRVNFRSERKSYTSKKDIKLPISLIVIFQVLSFIGSPNGKSSLSSISIDSIHRPVSKSARKLQLDDDGYDSFNNVSIPSLDTVRGSPSVSQTLIDLEF